MLNTVKKFRGYTVKATDGEAGTVRDVYFDDENWTIRYLVIETGGWFSGRKVLISPFSVLTENRLDGEVLLNLTKEQIKSAPDIDTNKPVSRQHESDLLNHYGYPYYWAGPMVWGYTPYPGVLAASESQYADSPEARELADEERRKSDPHLRSAREVIGYDIEATDDRVGHVEDFMFDVESWTIRLMVVDTRNWWPGKHVMISPKRIDHVSWEDKRIAVAITREEVENSPEYDTAVPPANELHNDVYWRFETPPR